MKTIVVASGLCAPARSHVQKALRPYSVQFRCTSWAEHEDGTRGPDDGMGLYNVARVRVNDGAARWAEYLLLRTGHFQLLSKPIDQRNERWAVRWNGRMPQPWVEAGCKARRPEQSNQRKRRGWFNQLFGG